MAKQTPVVKISRPRLSTIVPRHRKFELLDAHRDVPVTWISGPGGGGKTTLVASYLDNAHLPCIWYQVDEGDNDIASFFFYLSQAGHRADIRGKGPLPLLTLEYFQDVATFSRRYFENFCSRLRTPHVFVFDNFQTIPPESPFHALFIAGLSVVPQEHRVFLISREEPGAAYARAFANREMSALGWEELRLSPDESREIIRLRTGNRLRPELEQTIIERTDGWPAGIVLMSECGGDSAADRVIPGELAAARIFEYFASELFERGDQETRDFLLKTSLLQKFSVADAQSLTGARSAAAILENLAKRYFFTFARQGRVRTYEYHPLFREFLEDRARRTYTEAEWRDLTRRAAHLLLEAGEIEDAARLLRASGSWDGMAALVLTSAGDLVAQGRSHTVQEWMESFPAPMVEGNPWLTYWHGVCSLTTDLAGSRSRLESAFHAFRRQQDLAGMLVAWAGIVETFVLDWGDLRPLDHWIAEIEAILREQPSFPSPQIEAMVTHGVFCAMMYRQPRHPALPGWAARAMEIALANRDTQLGAFLSSHLVLYYAWWRGDTAKSGVLVSSLQSQVESKAVSPLTRIVWLASAAAHAWIIGDGGACQGRVADAMELARSSGIHLWDFMLLTNATFDALCRGDQRAADGYLRMMSACLSGGRKGDIIIYHWQMGWKALCEGRYAEALFHEELALQIAREAGFAMVFPTLFQGAAEALIELGDFAKAREYLDQAANFTTSMGSGTYEYMRHWLDAYYYLRRGATDQARSSLERHLAVSRKKGILNHVQWRPGVMAQLYGMALAGGIEVAQVQRLIRTHRLTPPEAYRHLESWPWPLKVHTFGGFRLVRNGEPVTYSHKAPKKPLELLRMVIALGGKGLTEERLIDLLWPDADGDSGRKSLNVTLARLRALLDVKDAVLVNDGILSLNDEVVWTDVRLFEEWVADGMRNEGSGGDVGSCQDAIEPLRRAIGLYRGEFLVGETAAWVIARREQLRGLFLSGVEALGRRLEERNELSEAIEVYKRGIEADALAERLYICSMYCLLRLGSQAEALSVYRRLENTLNCHGVAPSRAATEVHRKIVGVD